MEDKVRRRKMVPKVVVEDSRDSILSTASELDSDLSSGHGRISLPRETNANNGAIKTEPSLTEIIEDDDVRIVSDRTPLLDDEETATREDRRKDDDVIDIEVKDTGETALSIALQIFLPYIIAGFGMVGAGMVLDVVQHWEVFQKVSEVFILVPALLGLKGNLEMTLASRLSTQANLGKMDTSTERWKMIGGNLALVQAQAIVVGFAAAMAAMVFGWIPNGKFDIGHGLLLCAASVATASSASFVLGVIMIGVVLGSRKCNVNPDNVATPIAASLGDLTTLALLAAISTVLYRAITACAWLSPVILATFLVLIPVWCVISAKNTYTSEVIYTGWTPVISAMMISSAGGLILDFAVVYYRGIAVFQPVINGVGGNLVAVQASRISTALHRVSKPGELPEDAVKGCPNPCTTFFGKNMNAKTARVLMLMVVPGHLIFIYTIHYMNAGHTSITPIFSCFYLIAAVLQVALLLYIANWMVHYMWHKGDDPDNFSIPYLTAIGDLLGTGFLALAFHILYLIGDRDADVGD